MALASAGGRCAGRIVIEFGAEWKRRYLNQVAGVKLYQNRTTHPYFEFFHPVNSPVYNSSTKPYFLVKTTYNTTVSGIFFLSG